MLRHLYAPCRVFALLGVPGVAVLANCGRQPATTPPFLHTRASVDTLTSFVTFNTVTTMTKTVAGLSRLGLMVYFDSGLRESREVKSVQRSFSRRMMRLCCAR